MKRRDFFKRSGAAAAGVGVASVVGQSCTTNSATMVDRDRDQWNQMGNSEAKVLDRSENMTTDVAVVGGGLAGVCAAVAAARNGAKVILVQDRPVLGGNSSSEIRVHVNGVNHLRKYHRAERETGIIEEILLDNRFQNPQESYPVWDYVLYDFVNREPNIELLLNTQAVGTEVKGSAIQQVKCWQNTTEKEITISAKQFIDCSGDGLMAASAGALYRTGREASSEYNEKYAPKKADGWQMGSTILFGCKKMDKPIPFEAPSFTIPWDASKSNKRRKLTNFQNGIWWVEVGSNDDIVGEAEEIRKKLMGYAYGVWDYIKNSGEVPDAEYWVLDWIGSIPGRRESRRFIGDHVLSEPDLLGHKEFPDAVAFGGWSLDEHCWAGIENPDDPPSYFHEHFSEIYQIPYRSLYSKNISNLQFAGRNISQTHISLSSARVMCTCSLMGQAVGTAATLCVKHGVNPRDVAQNYVSDLQEQLLRDDVFIPHRYSKDETDVARSASRFSASSTSSGNAKNLINGISRDFEEQNNHWASVSLPASAELGWEKPKTINRIDVKCDTNVHRNILMTKSSRHDDRFCNTIPPELTKSISVEGKVNGVWKTLGEINRNKTRLIKFTFDSVTVSDVRVNVKETYGVEKAKLFEIRCYQA